MMSEYCILFLFLACFPKETKLTQLFCLAVHLLVCQPLFNNFEPVGWFQAGRQRDHKGMLALKFVLVVQFGRGQSPNTLPSGEKGHPRSHSGQQQPPCPSPGCWLSPVTAHLSPGDRSFKRRNKSSPDKGEGRRPFVWSVGHQASLLLLECAFMTKKKASKTFSL